MTKAAEAMSKKMRAKNRAYLERLARARARGPEHSRKLRLYWRRRKYLEAVGRWPEGGTV